MKYSKKLFFLIVLLFPVLLMAQDAAPTVQSNADKIAAVQTNADYVWTLIAAFLVFFMVLQWLKQD